MVKGGGNLGVTMLIGTLAVSLAMLGLVLSAGSFGHTHRLNADLTAPQLATPAAPGFK